MKMKKKTKDGNKTSKAQKIYNYTVIISIAVFTITSQIYRNRVFKYTDITVGKITGVSYRYFFPDFQIIHYEYVVNGKTYSQKEEFFRKDLHKGELYYIEYSIENPRIHDVLIDRGKVSRAPRVDSIVNGHDTNN